MAKKKGERTKIKYWITFKGYPYGEKSKMIQTYNIPCATWKDAQEIAKNLKEEGDVWGIEIQKEKLKRLG
ncbi:MAG: hypothetical protein AM326_08285 [Candidatus Thorarchaeota archaeon SMTZ-45]|nr:MAG: hypothetical protein AM326_08285 [Candidatus Thorarchaeota archaeon SMTZ-45]